MKPYTVENYATARRVIGPGIQAMLYTIATEAEFVAEALNIAYAEGAKAQAARVKELEDEVDGYRMGYRGFP